MGKPAASLKQTFTVFAMANFVLVMVIGVLLAWKIEREVRVWPAVIDAEAAEALPAAWSSDSFFGSSWACNWLATPENLSAADGSAEIEGEIVCSVETVVGGGWTDSEALLGPWQEQVDPHAGTITWLADDDPLAPTDPLMASLAVLVSLSVAGALASRLDWSGEMLRLMTARCWGLAGAGVLANLLIGVLAWTMEVAPLSTAYLPVFTVPVVVLAVLAVPLAEELNYRGLLYEGLRGRAPVWQQATLNALLFALSHSVVLWSLGGDAWTSAIAMESWLIAGYFFFFVRHYSGSVIIAWTAHASFNAMSLGYAALRHS